MNDTRPMHDDDVTDDDEVDGAKGRLYYSGINPDADRADYALRRGEPALQDGDVEFEPLVEVGEPKPLSRRGLLVLGIGVGVSAPAAWYFGDRRSSVASPTIGDRRRVRVDSPAPAWSGDFLEGARKAAEGPIEDLVRDNIAFVSIVGAYGGSDARLWEGMVRLAEFVRLDRSRKGYEVAKRILAAFELNPPPLRLRRIDLELQEFVRVWEKTHR